MIGVSVFALVLRLLVPLLSLLLRLLQLLSLLGQLPLLMLLMMLLQLLSLLKQPPLLRRLLHLLLLPPPLHCTELLLLLLLLPALLLQSLPKPWQKDELELVLLLHLPRQGNNHEGETTEPIAEVATTKSSFHLPGVNSEIAHCSWKLLRGPSCRPLLQEFR
jgi:hypothetical protein